jgi:hypothetical protein
MKRTVALLAFALVACGPTEEPESAPESALLNPTWFICDAIDAPLLYLVTRDGDTARIAEYEKPSGAIIERMQFTLGETEGAAGSVHQPLLRDGVEVGAIRQRNPGMLENPAAAYTPPIASVRLNGVDATCRWLPRTRAMAFTGRRSVVVHEDADGDLIYTTYDFATAATAAPIELSENARTTAFSLEVRGGEETLSPEGARYAFANAGFRYLLRIARDGAGALEVYRDGEANPVQTEALIASQFGDAAT